MLMNFYFYVRFLNAECVDNDCCDEFVGLKFYSLLIKSLNYYLFGSAYLRSLEKIYNTYLLPCMDSGNFFDHFFF